MAFLSNVKLLRACNRAVSHFYFKPVEGCLMLLFKFGIILNHKSITMKIKSIFTVILVIMFTGISLLGQEPAFKISLAEWSLNRTLRKGTITNMDFPKIAKETYGLDAVEYVST